MASLAEAREKLQTAIESGDYDRANAIADRIEKAGYQRPRVPEPPAPAPVAAPPAPRSGLAVERLQGMPQTREEAEQSISQLNVIPEYAAAANRGTMDVLDFFGPGSLNAMLRWGGTDFQFPTFSGGHGMTPGAEGGFMAPGTGRDVVQAAGEVLGPGAAAMVPVAGRNLAKVPSAAAELVGAGYAAPGTTAGRVAATQGAKILEPGWLSDAPSQIPAPVQQTPMAKRADAAGFPISPGERTGSRTLRNLEAGIESMAIPFNPAHRQAAQRQRMMNEAAAEALGLDRRTPLYDETLGDVAEELSDEFNSLINAEDIPGGALADDLVDIQDRARSRIFQDPDIEKVINKVFDRLDAEGNLSARDYQDITSELKAKVRQAWKGESPDPYFAETLGEIIDTLDNLAQNAVSPQDLAKLENARRRWKVLTQLEKSRAVHESGDVSAPLLANYLRRTDKSGYGRGGNRSPLYETARLSKAFPSRPDSGTATRQYLNQLMQSPVGGTVGLALSPLASPIANAYWHAPLLYDAAQIPLRSTGPLGRVGGYLED